MCHASEQEPKHFPFLKKTRLAFNNVEKVVNILMKDYHINGNLNQLH